MNPAPPKSRTNAKAVVPLPVSGPPTPVSIYTSLLCAMDLLARGDNTKWRRKKAAGEIGRGGEGEFAETRTS